MGHLMATEDQDSKDDVFEVLKLTFSDLFRMVGARTWRQGFSADLEVRI